MYLEELAADRQAQQAGAPDEPDPESESQGAGPADDPIAQLDRLGFG